MDINRNNYEAFLLDLLEGRLSVEEERELNEFLKHHPEHVVDLPDIDLVSLEKTHVSFPGRDQLRKEFPSADTHLSEANFDLFSIARMEGDLAPHQEEEHQSMIQDEARRLEEWSVWQKTRLIPERIQFHGKKSLKRKQNVKARVIWLSAVSVAATFAVVFTLLRMDPAIPGPELTVASNEELVPAQVPSVAIQEPAMVARVEESSAVEEEEAPIIVRKDAPIVVREDASLMDQAETAIAKNVTELPGNEDTPAGLSNSSPPIEAEKLEPRPLRIAGHLSASSEQVAISSSDRIEPLDIPQVSPNLTSLSVSQLAEMDRKKLFDDFTEENNISLLSVANAGIKGINKLTGSDISLMASKDEEGDVSGFRLKSKRFSVTRPLARQE